MRIKTIAPWVAMVLLMIAAVGVNTAEGQPADPQPAAGATAAAPAASPAAPATDDGCNCCKVAFVNLKRVLDESDQGKKLKDSLEAERDKAFDPLKARQDELDKLEGQITALTQEIMNKQQVWDKATLYDKQLELQNLQMQYQNLYNKLQLEKAKVSDSLNKKKDEMLKPLEKKLNEVMEKIGADGGYCLVLDVSPPAQNLPNFNPILYRNPALDITDEVIAAVDKQ